MAFTLIEMAAQPAPTAGAARDGQFGRGLERCARIAPGLLLCIAVTLAARMLQGIEESVFGKAWLESLVLAILLGAAVRTGWTPSSTWRPGVEFSAKLLLEIAVVLLGASVSVATLLAAGPGLLGGIAVVVAAAIGAS